MAKKCSVAQAKPTPLEKPEEAVESVETATDCAAKDGNSSSMDMVGRVPVNSIWGYIDI